MRGVWRAVVVGCALLCFGSQGTPSQSPGSDAEEAEAIDWHEWITDDEHLTATEPGRGARRRRRTDGTSGAAELSWASHASWRALANASQCQSQSPSSSAASGGSTCAPPPRPPVFLLAGIASTRLVNWREKTCKGLGGLGSAIKARDVVWVNPRKLLETMTIDPTCWVDCMKVGPRGTDPVAAADVREGHSPACVVRPDEGLDAVSAMAPGLLTASMSQVYGPLIDLLTRELGYVGGFGSLRALAYDWRLSPRRLEERDGFFSATKLSLEHAVARHGRPAVVFAHSMGNLVFLYFLDWLKAAHFGGNEGPWKAWVGTHVWCYVGLSAPLLGASRGLRTAVDGETFGLPISDTQAREMELTFDSTHWLNPRRPHAPGLPRGANREKQPRQKQSGGRQAQGSWWSAKGGTGERSGRGSGSRRLAGEQFGGRLLPLVSARDAFRHARRRGEWPTDLVRVRLDPRSNRSTAFGVGDVESGRLFRWLADYEAGDGGGGRRGHDAAQECDVAASAGAERLLPGGGAGPGGDCGSSKLAPLAQRKAEALSEEYWSDPWAHPLSSGLLRPPVRHVIMAFGVDVPTDLAYRYVAEKSPAAAEKAPTKTPEATPATPQAASAAAAKKKAQGAGGAATATNGVGGGGGGGCGGGPSQESPLPSSARPPGPRLVLEEAVREEIGGRLVSVRLRDATTFNDQPAPTRSEAGSKDGGGGGSGGDALGKATTGGKPSSSEKGHRQRKGDRNVLRAGTDDHEVLAGGKAPKAGAPQLSSSSSSSSRRSGHSGDGTVPYLSLAWAHSWLEDQQAPTVRLTTRAHHTDALRDDAEASNDAAAAAAASPDPTGGNDGGWTTLFGAWGKGATAKPMAHNNHESRTLWQRQSVGRSGGGTIAVTVSLLRDTVKRAFRGGTAKQAATVASFNGPTTTTVLEIAGARHTSLTTDPATLTLVLAHVLRHMDNDLDLPMPPVQQQKQKQQPQVTSSTTTTTTSQQPPTKQPQKPQTLLTEQRAQPQPPPLPSAITRKVDAIGVATTKTKAAQNGEPATLATPTARPLPAAPGGAQGPQGAPLAPSLPVLSPGGATRRRLGWKPRWGRPGSGLASAQISAQTSAPRNPEVKNSASQGAQIQGGDGTGGGGGGDGDRGGDVVARLRYLAGVWLRRAFEGSGPVASPLQAARRATWRACGRVASFARRYRDALTDIWWPPRAKGQSAN